VFNLQGSELIIILLLALVVLGPEKLPEAMRKLGQLYAELKKMSSGFQQEFRNATNEPVREIRETANALRDSVDFRKLAGDERAEKPKSAEMAAATPSTAPAPPSNTTVAPSDPDATPTGAVPGAETTFAPPAADSRAPESAAIGPPPIAPVDIAPETIPPEGQNEGT
jgi:sec-independent protein translocase protein TatB